MTRQGRVFTSSYPGLSDKLINQVDVYPYYTDDGGVFKMPSIFNPVYNALWDTGANKTVVSHTLAEKLKLKNISQTNVATAGGNKTALLHSIYIVLPNNVIINTIAAELPIEQCDLLIGMDVIGKGDFIVSNFEGKTCFTFRMPSMHCYDFRKRNYL